MDKFVRGHPVNLPILQNAHWTLLPWALILARKPLLNLRRSDTETFMEICLNRRVDWIGPMIKSRFKQLMSACCLWYRRDTRIAPVIMLTRRTDRHGLMGPQGIGQFGLHTGVDTGFRRIARAAPSTALSQLASVKVQTQPRPDAAKRRQGRRLERLVGLA